MKLKALNRTFNPRWESKMKALKMTAFLMLCTSLALPFAALGQSADAKYCSALIEKVRNELGGTQASGDVPVAISKCNAGDTAAGIPILEKTLKDAKVTLPPRG
jgi:hypothetical protein